METDLLFLFLISITSIMAKEDDLPLCPTNVQFLPQNLPMHCRMPRSADFPPFPPMPPGAPPIPNLPPQFYQSPLQDKQQSPVPIPFPPGGAPMPFPGPMPAPGPMPMPMMPMQGPAHKLPVIVMPFYKPDPSFRSQIKKHRHPKKDPRLSDDANTDSTDSDTESDTDIDAETDTSSDTSSDKDSSRERGWWKRRGISKKDYRRSRKHKKIGRRLNSRHKSRSEKRNFRRKELLTPVLQYVTKDGYVIFEKQISKDEAKDWLRVRKDDDDDDNSPSKKNDNLSFDQRELDVQKVSPKQSKIREEDKPKSNEEEDNGDKSKEQANIIEETTTSRVRVRKHRRRKPNLLIADKPHKHTF